MKKIKILFFLLIPLWGFSQNYHEEVTQEVINGQEVTVVRTTQTKVKAQSKPKASKSTTSAVPKSTNLLSNFPTTTKKCSNERSTEKDNVKSGSKEEPLFWLFNPLGIEPLNSKSKE